MRQLMRKFFLQKTSINYDPLCIYNMYCRFLLQFTWEV